MTADRVAPSLNLLACGLSGSVLQVQAHPRTAAADAPPVRPTLTATHLLLPPASFALERAAVAHAAAHRRFSRPHQSARTLKPMGLAVVSALEDARVERLMVREYPGMRHWFLHHLGKQPEPEDLSFAALMARLDRALADPAYLDDNHWVNKARNLFESQAARNLADAEAFRAHGSVLANDLGQMRVRFDPQQFAVAAAYRDDHSYLWDYGDGAPAPEEALALHTEGVRRSRRQEPTAHAQPMNGAPEIELGRYVYPEWDRRLERLRPDWCTVIEKLPAWTPESSGAAVPAPAWAPIALPLRRARRIGRTRRLRRQWEGDELDLNAAIDVWVDRKLHRSSEPRLFMRAGRDPCTTSILVLLDLSESTNDAIDGTPFSLLDIEKQAALLLADSMAPGSDRVAIDGFSSNTRAEVHYHRLLDFGAPLEPVARAMVGAAPGRYSTRIGAALRHAVERVREEPSDRRAILLVTDGAPSDVDVPDPRDLIEDARMSVLEARRAGVHCHGLAVDPQADDYVRRIFGTRDHSIIANPHSLSKQLQRVCIRLSAN